MEMSSENGGTRFDASVTAVVSSEPYVSSNHRCTTYSPSRNEMHWTGEISTKGTSSLRPADSKLKLRIAEKLAEKLVGEMAKAIPDDRRFIVANESLYPVFHAPPEFKFLNALEAKLFVSGTAFEQPASTVWRVNSSLNLEELWRVIKPELAESGWSDASPPSPSDEFSHAWSDRRTESLQCFEVRTTLYAPRHPDQKPDAEKTYLIVYSRQLDEQQWRQLVLRFVQEDAGEPALLQARQAWHLEREAVKRYFDEHPPQSVETWVALVRNGLLDDTEQARRIISQTPLLYSLYGRQYDIPNDLKEKLDITEMPHLLDLELLPQMGVPDLRQVQEQQLTVFPGHPAIALYDSSDLEQQFLVINLKPGTEQPGIKFAQVSLHQHGFGSTATEFTLQPGQRTPLLSCPFTVEPLDSPAAVPRSLELILRRVE
jgi:hypothetical protein